MKTSKPESPVFLEYMTRQLWGLFFVFYNKAMLSICLHSEMSSNITAKSYKGTDAVLCLSGKVIFPLLPTPTCQTLSTKLGVCFRFQSEKETGDRNYAIGYYLKEKKVSGTDQ